LRQSLEIQDDKVKIFGFVKKVRGAVFITVMVISMLMIFLAVSVSNMILQDAYTIKRLKLSTQAQYLAEAGISDALGTLVRLGFSAKDNPLNFTQQNLGGGTYDVTVIQNAGRVLLSSLGVVDGVEKTVSLEVKDSTPTSLYYMLSSGSDFTLRAFLLGWADINGDIHSNGNMLLHALWAGWIDIDVCAVACLGDVSACGLVTENEGWAGNISYSGSLTNGAPPVTFPNFDYDYYKNLAIASGDYYAGDVVFDNQDLTPGNGIIYVEGTARFRNVCNLNGGIVANRILVLGELHQHKTGTKNIIVSRNLDIRLTYRLETEEALVYSGRDFRAFGVGGIVNITGVLIAARYLRIGNALTHITYNHKIIYPDGLIIGAGGSPTEVVSWNR